MKRFWVNTDLVDQFILKNELASLAVYFRIKTIYENSTIFSPTNAKLENLLGVSRVTLKKHLRILEENGLLVKHGSNLTAISYHKKEIKPTRRNGITIYLNEKDAISSIVRKLQFSVLKKRASQQVFMIKLFQSLDQEKAKVNLRHYKKYARERYGEKGRKVNPELCMSVEKIAALLHCSPQSASRIKKEWEKLKLVRFYRRFKVIGCVSGRQRRAVKDALPNGAFVAGNGLIRQSEPSVFEILDQKKQFKVKKAKSSTVAGSSSTVGNMVVAL